MCDINYTEAEVKEVRKNLLTGFGFDI